jgi:hypothetical protein
VTVPTDQADATDTRPDTAPSDAPKVYLDLPDLPSQRSKAPAPRRRSRWWRYGFPSLLVVLVLAVPALVYAGVQVVLATHDGRLIAATASAGSPGWQATVPPTPTAMVATLNADGSLSSVSVLALTADREGGVLFIPVDTQVSDGSTTATLVDFYRTGGNDGLKRAVESLLHAGIGTVVVNDAQDWQDLATPAGPLTIANPDQVVVDGKLLFQEGTFTLAPDQTASYLESRNWAEDDTNRLLRHEVFWKAWLAKVAASRDPGIVPGEVNSGIGRFVRTLAHDKVDYEVLPVRVQAFAHAYAGYYVPLAEAPNVVNSLIPFPTSATSGARPTIRVLDGTGRLNHGLIAAHNLVGSGVQIDSIGNAAAFGQTRTQLIIPSNADRAVAERLQQALGVGSIVVASDGDDSIAVTVVLGADALDRPAARTTTTIAGG